MKIGVVKELMEGENRVAISPTVSAKLVKKGFEIAVERGAGNNAGFTDDEYKAAGATIHSKGDVWSTADVVAKINPPQDGEMAGMKDGATLISILGPRHDKEIPGKLAKQNISTIALDAIPRITRAQKMDILSSMANIAGYRAVIEASHHFGSFFTGQITAAGKVAPAKVLVIGAGVAGLAALGAAKSLGAIVRAFDTREAAAEQVESLGGQFLRLEFEESGEGKGGYAKVMSKEFIDAEMALFREQAPEVDIVITTALIPGRKAPLLWTKDMVEKMKPGSVVVDLAATQGGNCEVTQNGRVVIHDGVKVLGFSDLPSRMARVSSELFGTNIYHLLMEMGGAEAFTIDESNDVVRQALVTRDGTIKWPPPEMDHPKPVVRKEPEPEVVAKKEEPKAKFPWLSIFALGFVGLWCYLRFGDVSVSAGSAMLLQQITVFVLACFVGWQVVWNVTAALHTPLMAVTNAISGIIVVGGLLGQTSHDMSAAVLVSAAAVFFATINIAGGFFVTHRMLKMFRK